jgi:hypothetical protein
MGPDRALELATEVAVFLESQRLGATWTRPGPTAMGSTATGSTAKSDHTLYHGTAGIILFLLELTDATGDPQYRLRAEEAGRELASVVVNKTWASVGFGTGWPGYAFVLDVLHQRTGDAVYARAVQHCHERLMAQASSLEGRSADGGLRWIEPMPFSDITGFTGDREVYDLSVGAAGAGVTLLSLAESSMCTEDQRTLYVHEARLTGERLLQVGESTDDGIRWGLMADMPFPFTAPNFAHGGAGVGYFLALLSEATSDRRFLEAALRAGDYVVSKMTPVGDGCLVCHTEEQQPPRFYLGACHGPAGTGRLFSLLGRLTGDDRWAHHITSMVSGVLALGAPEERSWGWWKNHSRCCGDAGLGDAALLLASTSRGQLNKSLMLLADRCAVVLEAESTVSQGGRSWLQAEHRTRPDFLQIQPGYMQGAAGIGSFLIHLATASSDRPVRITLPDERL